MARSSRSRRNAPDEHPALKSRGLKTVPIKGDGNCMFSAFSDQFYGDVSQAKAIRAKVVAHERDHPDDFKPFISVGGWRRAPKRKNHGSYNCELEIPDEEQKEQAFQAHLERMGKNGTYGENLEITAFANEFKVDVKVYGLDGLPSYFIKSSEPSTLPVVHIARHSFEHYSSVRNIAGPATGLPNIVSQEEERSQECTSSSEVTTPASSVCSSPASYVSSGAISIERDQDGNDDEVPNKRQNRKGPDSDVEFLEI